jgi:hypothetical protein
MRRALLLFLVIVGFSSRAALAQTDTPTPTATPTSTPTPTPTPTPLPTLDLNRYVTVIPPGGSPEDAQDGALRFEVTAGQVMNALLGLGLVLIAVIELILKLRGRGGE